MTLGRAWRTLPVFGLVVVLAAGALGAFSDIRLRTEDLNGDGRPDVWKYYDERDTLIRVAKDTNFDGRSDIEETYVDGRLVTRSIDRNFDDRVDRIDRFDPTSGERVESTIDVDFDGRADVLVFFADGQPVSVRWADDHGPSPPLGLGIESRQRTADDPLESLANPFSTTTRLRTNLFRTERLSEEPAGISLLVTILAVSTRLEAARIQGARSDSLTASPCLALCGPRGPPARQRI